MGFCLIAAFDLSLIVIILEVALALGAVIFVHELGHFAVAKLCGVKCEKFYLGFGPAICKVRWGETEYGIGILPLGGFVKMLGQEDNPARLREEIERAKQKQAAEAGAVTSSAKKEPAGKTAGDKDEETIDIQAAEQALYDPRSYLSKSVPQRMAIISAGVIMNVIFAFFCAVVAYKIGVRQISPLIGGVIPGRPAWQMGFRPGDRVVEIGGVPIKRFDDLKKKVSLGDVPDDGLLVVVDRLGPDGKTQRVQRHVQPSRGGMMPTIGVIPHSTTALPKSGSMVAPGSAAEKASPAFEHGDQIVKIDGQPIASYAALQAYLASHVEGPLNVTVERDKKTVDISLPPNPMRTLGLVMQMGPVSAIEEDSPAAKAGLKEADLIVAYADDSGAEMKPVGDPMTWPSRLRALAGKPIEIEVRRDGKTVKIPVTLRSATWFEQPLMEGTALSVPELGLAYRVLNRVEAVLPDSPAAKAGLKAGDVVTAAKVTWPKDYDKKRYADLTAPSKSIEFGDKERNWPFFMYYLQGHVPGATVTLTLEGKDDVTLEPSDAPDWFNPARGMYLDIDVFEQKAETWGEAVQLGAEETWSSLTMVVAFIRKLSHGGISIRGVGGPVTIAMVAGQAASDGVSSLLMFLVMLSANLAVLNFLPIPILDGGHMVFLAYEGIRGKPADERVQLVLSYFGVAFLLGLMLLALGLDVGLISRHVPLE